MLRPAVFALTLGALLLAACDADEPAPAGPVGGGNPVPGGSTGGGEVDASHRVLESSFIWRLLAVGGRNNR